MAWRKIAKVEKKAKRERREERIAAYEKERFAGGKRKRRRERERCTYNRYTWMKSFQPNPS